MLPKVMHLNNSFYKCLKIGEHFKSKLLSKNIINNSVKSLSTNERHSEDKQKSDKSLELPPLMRFTPKGVPNVFYSVKNQLIVSFYIKPYIDRDFNTHQFLNGAKQALVSISSHLANDDMNALESLVTNEALKEIKQNYLSFTPQQKQQLRVSLEDILFCFPYSIQFKEKGSDKTIVKIFVVYDCIQNINDLLREDSDMKNISAFSFNKYLDRKYLCNYEFIREYVKGVESDWIVSKLNHIKDRDIIKRFGLFSK